MSKLWFIVLLSVILYTSTSEKQLPSVKNAQYRKFLGLAKFAYYAYRNFCHYCRATLVLRDFDDVTSNLFLKQLSKSRSEFNMSIVIVSVDADSQWSIRGESEDDVTEFVLFFWTIYKLNVLEDYLNEVIILPYWYSCSKIVIILSESNALSEVLISFTFRSFWKLRVLRVFLCMWDEKTQSVRIYRYNPFTEEYAIDVSNESKDELNRLLEFELLDLNGYPMATYVYDTYQFSERLMKLDILDDENKEVYVGMDGKMLMQVRDILNVTLNMILESQTHKLTTFLMSHGNDSSVLPAKFIEEENFDIWFNSIRAKPHVRAEYLFLHERDDLCMVVPKAEPLPQYLYVFLLVPGNVWGAVLLSAVAVSITVGALQFKKTYNRVSFAFMNIYGILLSSSLPSYTFNGRVRLRTILGIWIIFSLIFSLALQCTLTSTLVAPRFYPELNTMADVLEAKLPLYAMDYDANLFQQNAKGINAEILANSVIPLKTMTKDIMGSFQNKSGFLVRCELARDFLYDSDNGRYGSMQYHAATEHPVPNAQAYTMPRGHPYYEEIVWIIHKLHESGLFYQWRKNNFGWNSIPSEVETGHHLKRSKENEHKDFVQLTIAHLQTSFYLLSLGLTIATCSFFVELCLHKRTQCSRHS